MTWWYFAIKIGIGLPSGSENGCLQFQGKSTCYVLFITHSVDIKYSLAGIHRNS